MPLIHLSAPRGTFSNAARDLLAEELTVIALESEKLPMAPFDKSTTWIYFHELPPAKLSLYKGFTEAIRQHAGIPRDARVPAYIVLREELRKAHPDEAPI